MKMKLLAVLLLAATATPTLAHGTHVPYLGHLHSVSEWPMLVLPAVLVALCTVGMLWIGFEARRAPTRSATADKDQRNDPR